MLECVPHELAAQISSDVAVPTIGIGAGAGCNGQVLVLHDLLGVTPGKRPRFVKDFLEQGGSIRGAVERYAAAVRDGSFPTLEQSFE